MRYLTNMLTTHPTCLPLISSWYKDCWTFHNSACHFRTITFVDNHYMVTSNPNGFLYFERCQFQRVHKHFAWPIRRIGTYTDDPKSAGHMSTYFCIPHYPRRVAIHVVDSILQSLKSFSYMGTDSKYLDYWYYPLRLAAQAITLSDQICR